MAPSAHRKHVAMKTASASILPSTRALARAMAELQVRAADVEAESRVVTLQLLQGDLGVEDLGTHRGCSVVDLLLHPAVIGAAGELRDSDRCGHGAPPPRPLRNFRMAATNAIPSSSVVG